MLATNHQTSRLSWMALYIATRYLTLLLVSRGKSGEAILIDTGIYLQAQLLVILTDLPLFI